MTTNLNNVQEIAGQIFERAPYPIMVFEPSLLENNGNYTIRLVLCNQQAKALFPCPQVGDIPLVNMVFPDPEATDIYKLCVDALLSDSSHGRLLSLKTKSGYIAMFVEAVKMDQYIVLYLQSTGKKNNANQAQIEEEIKYRELFETSLDAIFLAVDNFNITSINPKFCDIFKYEGADLDTLELKVIFRHMDAYLKFIDLLHQRKFVEEFEAELLTSDGEIRYCIINAIPVLDDHNKLHVYQGVIRDMTSRREAEQQLIIAEKLTLTGRLARSIAHEVRNPLTNIRLAIDQFKEELPEEPGDADFYLEMIARNTERISNLITDLMNSSKQKMLELKKCQVNEVLTETIELIQDRIKLKKIAIETELAKALPDILLDKNQSKIAFLNILLNAIEAMPAGNGLLRLRTSTNGKHVAVEISDNGKGIPDEELGNLFEPFYTGRKDGSGLGLTTTRNIVHAHQGSIKVHSTPGEGTTFTLLFSVLVSATQMRHTEEQ
ncbi:MAG: PAS domain S-box protein [Cyclobacteriaceae bacterium]|nr:PAS domain S-box protein [Cyclobacteriaceae bacterium]